MSEESTLPIEDIKEFFQEAESDLGNAENLLLTWNTEESAPDTIDQIFRAFHNIKGASGMFSLLLMQELFHVSEDLLGVYRENKRKAPEEVCDLLVEVIDEFRKIAKYIVENGAEPSDKPYPLLGSIAAAKKKAKNPDEAEEASSDEAEGADPQQKSESKADDSIRISGQSANELVEIVSDFIQLQNRLLATLGDSSDSFAIKNDIKRFSAHLQNFVLSIRLSPVQPLLSGLHRVVKSAAKETGKQVRLKISGGETQLDRRVIDLLRDPMIHLIRNAVDHGLENPEQRKESKKRPEGIITVEAAQQAGQVVMTISDDGKGIDPEAVKRKAMEKGLLTEEAASKLSKNEAVNLVFMPGFSTKEKATQISGRGVGMDAVKTAVESIGGGVEINSTLDVGSKFILTLPLTLAIVKTLAFFVGRQLYAVPQVNVEEVITRVSALAEKQLEMLEDGHSALRIRKEVIPVVSLVDLLKSEHKKPEDSVFIVVKQRGTRFALEVDRISGTRDFVSQPVPSLYESIEVISGVNQLNSGEYIGLLDLMAVSHLVQPTRNQGGKSKKFSGSQQENQESTDGTVSEVFRSQQKLVFFKSGKHFAVPVQSVKQVINVSSDCLDEIGEKYFLTHEGKTYPILRLFHHFGGKDLEHRKNYTVLLSEREGKRAATVCEEFYGIHRLPAEFEDLVKTKGVLGSINREGTTFLVANIFSIFEIEFPDEFRSVIDNSKNFNVLVAEDDTFFATSLMDYLRSNDCNPILARDGLEAKNILLESLTDGSRYPHINYLVTDLEMPNLNGLDVLRFIRKHADFANLPATMCTAVGDAITKAEAESLGVDAFVGKMRYEDISRGIIRRQRELQVGVVSETVTDHRADDPDLAQGERRVLTFMLGDKDYGVEIEYLKEISNASVSTVIPGMNSFSNQMIAFRGHPIPVLDLCVLKDLDLKDDLGSSSAVSRGHREQIVAKFGEYLCALWVDKISNVKRLSYMDRSVGVNKQESGKSITKLIGDVLWDNSRAVALLDAKTIETLLGIIRKKTKSLCTSGDDEKAADRARREEDLESSSLVG